MVSIIIPTYNRAKILPRAINSILGQSYKDFELIVVDDCSSDNTDDVMKSFTDPRIRYIKHAQNKGGAAARNTGIKSAQREYVAFLDSDDEWQSEKLTKQVFKIVNSSDETGLVFCLFKTIDSVKKDERLYSVYKNEATQAKILTRNFIGTFSVVLIKKKFLDMVGGVDESLTSCQDWDLYVRLSRVCQFDFMNEALVKYYSSRSKNQISHNKRAIVLGYTRFIEKNKQELNALTVSERSEFLHFVGRVFIEVGAFRQGVYNIFHSFLLKKTWGNFKRVVKGMLVGIIIKIGLGDVYFKHRKEA